MTIPGEQWRMKVFPQHQSGWICVIREDGGNDVRLTAHFEDGDEQSANLHKPMYFLAGLTPAQIETEVVRRMNDLHRHRAPTVCNSEAALPFDV